MSERSEQRVSARLAGRTEADLAYLDALYSDIPVCYFCGEASLDGWCSCGGDDLRGLSNAEIVALSPVEIEAST